MNCSEISVDHDRSNPRREFMFFIYFLEIHFVNICFGLFIYKCESFYIDNYNYSFFSLFWWGGGHACLSNNLWSKLKGYRPQPRISYFNWACYVFMSARSMFSDYRND